jgi:putative flippase GtrA
MTQALDARRLFLLDRSRHGPFGRLIVDLFRYGAASGAALALDAGTLIFLNKAGVNYLAAAAAGFLAGLALVYVLSVRYVFRDSRALTPPQEVVGFLVTGLIGLALNEGLMGVFVGYCGLGVAIAKIPTVGVVFAFNFTVRRSLLFSKVDKIQGQSLAVAMPDLKSLAARVPAFPVWGSVTLALGAAFAFTFPHARQVWTSGAFFDTDDAMRAVQVRDLLAGQPWFDMTAWRLDPPLGVFSHWSRVVDAPLAAMQLFFRIFLTPERAELVTRLLFPFGLLGALFSLSPWFARALAANAPRHIAVLLALLSGAIYVQFLPGRIDHHAPQIVFLMTTLGFFLRGLEAQKARLMLAASGAMALSVAISLENLPFFAVMLAAASILFALDGSSMRAPLAWLACGILAAFPAAYAATVGPSRYFLAACDAFSWVYIAAFLVGALALGALSLLAPWLGGLRGRTVAVGIAGVVTGGVFAAIAPQCLGDPLGGVDPLVRELWLSRVTEATPLWKFWKTSPNVVPVTAMPVLFGLLVALARSLQETGLARRRWSIAAAVIAMGFLCGFFWQVRVFSSITPIAVAPLALVVVALADRAAGSFSPVTRALCAGVLCLAVTPAGLAIVLPQNDVGEMTEASSAAEVKPGSVDTKAGEAACLKPDVLAPLARLPAARVAAYLDFGPYVLAYTPHSVLAGPYHRDNHGNRLVIDAFLAKPADAETILRAAEAQIFLWCPGGTPRDFAKRAPDGLAAMLAKGAAPAWLERLNIAGTGPLQVYAVR